MKGKGGTCDVLIQIEGILSGIKENYIFVSYVPVYVQIIVGKQQEAGVIIFVIPGFLLYFSLPKPLPTPVLG